MVTKTSAETAKWLIRIVRDYVNLSPENNLQNDPPEKAFSDPLVGFSNGADPLWEDYKEHVGPFHLMPMDVFKDAFPSVSASSVDLTVISPPCFLIIEWVMASPRPLPSCFVEK